MRRVTLAQVFAGATVAIAIVVVLAFAAYMGKSRASILEASRRQQELVARRVQSRVVRELGRARAALDDVDRAIRSGAVSAEQASTLEPTLFLTVLDDEHLEEATFTHAVLLGHDAAGEARLAASGRWQVSVFRGADRAITTLATEQVPEGFSTEIRARGADAQFMAAPARSAGAGKDPTAHLTFSVAASRSELGHAIWTDLHWSERDQAAPPEQRRVVLSVQKTISDASGRFMGVLRVGIVTTELDALARPTMDPLDPEDVERVALLATSSGGAVNLVARVAPSDRRVTVGDDIRYVSDHPPPEMAALFASPLVRGLDVRHPNAAGSLDVAGAPWLATLRELGLGEGGTEGWMVAVLVPEARYTAELVAFERTFLVVFATTLALVLAIGASTLSGVRRGLASITEAATRMRAFDFERARHRSVIRDVDEVMQDLERAKTVVRAMGKYVPIDLVRRLYATNQEPQLGGEPATLSLMFTDIEGFTTLAEELEPGELARRLGDYLAAMTAAIEETGGTIDKYIGDAVMAIWNAPAPVAEHERRACRAALACMKATRALYASDAWAGLPPLVTRFGLHRAQVLVGHFGAPTRLSYTALGDGVNLAARLEPLCKQYGVVALASEDIVAAADGELVFRRIDRVAVKGKTTGIDVYELLGERGDDIPHLDRARRYEEALAAYLARDFAKAVAILETQREDPPSTVLERRCRDYLEQPPPPSWNGVYVASSK